MSDNKLSSYIQIAVAAVRAAYGDLTGLAVEGIKYAPRIIAIVCAIAVIVVILPVLFIQSLFIGDRNSPSGTFSELAIEALEYKEDWIKVLALAQTKKVISGLDLANIAEAARAVKDNTIETYLKGDTNVNDDYMKIFKSNLELLENMLCTYAGYVFYYDEIPTPPSYESINRIYNSSTGIHELEALIKVKPGP